MYENLFIAFTKINLFRPFFIKSRGVFKEIFNNFRKNIFGFSKLKPFTKNFYKTTGLGTILLFSALPIYQDDLESLKRKAAFYNNFNNFVELRKVSDEGLKKDPNNLCFLVYAFYSSIYLADKKQAKKFEDKIQSIKINTIEDQYYYGLYLISKGQIQKALEYMEYAANEGDIEAKHELGKWYCFTEDSYKGFKLVQEAYLLGHEFAKFTLIDLYMYSKNFGDPKKAVELLKEVENDKNDQVPYEGLISKAYLEGIGYEKNYKKGLEYMKKAADKGEVVSANNYSIEMYNHKNYEESFKYALMCYESGQPEIYPLLAELYIEGLGCQRNLQKGFELLEKSIEIYKDTFGMIKLSNYFLNEKYIEIDQENARGLLEECVLLKNDYCNYLLGMCYTHGIGVEKDFKKAKELLEKSPKSDLLINDQYLTHFPSEWKKE